MSAGAIETLRKIEDGTVVRFKVTFGQDLPGQTYQYGAIFISPFWYLTSRRESSALDDGTIIRPRLNQNGFEQVLASPQVSDVSVATEWTAL